MIENYLSCDNVKLLISVGCCYRRLSPGTHVSASFTLDGFPLSRYFRERNIQLDARLRNIASHGSRWTVDSLRLTVRKHFYRSVLEILLARHKLNAMIGKFRGHVYDKGFKEYVRIVVDKLQLPPVLIDEADIIQEYSEKDIIAAVCMRGMCTGVAESLIVLDRWMAIREATTTGYIGLHRLFDPQISPRGWALVAKR